jgi:hypothetical protein
MGVPRVAIFSLSLVVWVGETFSLLQHKKKNQEQTACWIIERGGESVIEKFNPF